MKRLIVLLLVLLLTLSVVACGDENSAIENVITTNAKAMVKEDVDAYMDTISAESELFDATKEQMGMIFDMYDLNVKIVEMDVLETKDDVATVRVVQETSNDNDQPFDANTATAVHTLIKVDGKWKIKSTELESVEKLEK